MKETYIVFDIETDGPIPNVNSMLSLGAAAVSQDLEKLPPTFYVNIFPLLTARSDPDTMLWWQRNSDAFEQTQKHQVNASRAMQLFVEWAKQFDGKPVPVAFPAGFDYTFLYWYLCFFLGKSSHPFSFSCIDMKTLGMAIQKKGYLRSTKRNYPKSWFGPHKHTHNALDDALGQRDLFISMMKELSKDEYDNTGPNVKDLKKLSNDCSSCGEECPKHECLFSKRPCGHHCNHSWSHEVCCWCGKRWGCSE